MARTGCNNQHANFLKPNNARLENARKLPTCCGASRGRELTLPPIRPSALTPRHAQPSAYPLRPAALGVSNDCNQHTFRLHGQSDARRLRCGLEQALAHYSEDCYSTWCVVVCTACTLQMRVLRFCMISIVHTRHTCECRARQERLAESIATSLRRNLPVHTHVRPRLKEVFVSSVTKLASSEVGSRSVSEPGNRDPLPCLVDVPVASVTANRVALPPFNCDNLDPRADCVRMAE